jgi:sirohydrochlorin ferrochelatase
MPADLSTPVLLVAHGSRDPRAAATTRAVARAVAFARPGLDVRVAFLELAQPAPAQVLRQLRAAGTPPPVVVPLLLSNAFHGRVDLPAQVAEFDCALTDTLGAVSEPLLAALTWRLHESCADYDAVVLAAAGTRMATARAGIEQVSEALGKRLNVPCRVAYASAADPTGEAAVMALRASGAARVAVASYFLAVGQLYDTVVSSALRAGAVAAAAPLGVCHELARLILNRVDSTVPTSQHEALIAA